MQYIQGRFEEHAQRFVQSKHDVEQRLKLVTSFRESIEIAHTSEYENFLKCLFPVFANALSEGAPMTVECDEQKIRNVLLEILNRLPNNEVLRPYVNQLLRLVMQILTIDNQENALICLRIIFDVHKNFSPNLESEVQPFINFFINLYKNLPETVQEVFQRKPNRTAISSDGTHVKVLTMSVRSFKVLTECPLIVMLLFQLYPQHVETNIHRLIPLMMRALTIQPPTNLTQQHSQLYSDFIAAQVKTLSFLTYVLRGFADRMQPHQDTLSKCVIQLLLNCPTSSINSRKELLVATRHILATNFRKGFFKKINMMLKEEVLIGQGRAHEIVRPLAYSTLADLVHHVRADLTIEQLSKVIYIFSRNIHDPTLPLSIQTASVRLILTLVDHIYRTQDAKDRGRTLLVRILSALVNKFDTLKDYIPKLIHLVNKKKKRVQAQGHTWTLAYTPRTEEEFPEDSVREVKQLMFTMVFGLKTVVWCISNFRSHSITHSQQRRPIVLDEVECRIVARFLQHGLNCFKIYTLPGFTRSRTQQIEKDVLEHFASVFTVLDPRSFRDVFSVQIETLFNQIVENQRLHMHMLIIPQHFLSSSNVSKAFADILLSFLTKKMKDMAKPSSESPVSLVLLNLFRIVFGSVTLFTENETVLRPYLNNIVSTAMKLIKEVEHPTNYLSLLRFLFRSIGGGKFELLYKEFLPLLPELLQGLMHIQARGPQSIREISIELCLTVPARLSSLLQFIPLLVQAVVLALKAKDEQVIKLGLRTLEFWVDNLNPEYLYPHMCTVLSDLMRALCALLRPHPSPFGVTALSVLGKLGGRNRRFLIEAFNVDNEMSSEQGLLIGMKFAPHHSFQLPMDKLIEYAGKILCKPALSGTSADEDKNAKKQAYLFLRTCMMVMIDRAINVTDSAFMSTLKSFYSGDEKKMDCSDHGDKKGSSDPSEVKSIQPCTSAQNREESDVVRSRSFNAIKEHVFQQLCKYIIIASSDKNLEEDADTKSNKFLLSISLHFSLLFVFMQKNLNQAEVSILDAKVFLDAIVEVMCNENRLWFKAAKATLDSLLDLFVKLLGRDKAGKLPVLAELLSKLSHCCYEDMWEPRHAGCMGLAALCDKMSPSWVRTNQGELIRAFMFTFRDSHSEFAAMTADQANKSLDKVVGISCSQYNEAAQIPDSGSATGSGTKKQDKMSITRALVTILAPELISGIYAVRTCAHRLLGLVSELSGTPVASILNPYRTRLLAPVLQQSLHAVPMSIRIGYISAATYCLSLRPPLVTVNDLLYLLHDAIADVRDDTAQNYAGGIAGRTGRVQLLNRLQVEDIKLMSAALASEDMKKNPTEYQELKNNLIRVFFRSLLSRTPEIVKVAKEGLKKVIDREKLPKELLQQCMRPILLNLADIRKLCMPLLGGLSRLLELLSNCFNVTLGEKLLDHMRKFADPEVLKKMRYDTLENGVTSRMKPEDEVQVAASIIGLFHLLPPASNKFLEPLVSITLKLESILPAIKFYGGFGTGSSSPYREPLIKFLVVEPRKTCEYFLRHLSTRKLSQMFQAIMRHKQCVKIRDVVMNNPDELIRHTFDCKTTSMSQRTELVIQGITIVHILSSADPKWLSGCKKIVDCLLKVWDSEERKQRLKEENELYIGHVHESKLVVECLIHYCRVHRTEVRILWKMLTIFLHRTLIDFTFLAEFYEKEIAHEWSAEEKKHITAGFLRFFAEQGQTKEQMQTNEQLKVKALQLIIIPILENTFSFAKRKLEPPEDSKDAKDVKDKKTIGEDEKSMVIETKTPAAPMASRNKERDRQMANIRSVLGEEMVTTLIKELIGGQQAIHYREELRVQLLRLTTLLIEHLHTQLTSYRKDLIKFAWNHLKSDNSASKQWAYVNVCRFIDVYETPPKIVLQVYVALLRTYQPEARKLVSKALDIITPALPKRLSLGKHKHPTWIKWTKKIIVEEGHLVPQLIHIWNLIIRHPDLFYQSRTQFVPQMVNSLNRLGLPQNRPPENRKLALDLADLIIRWDRRCLEEYTEKLKFESGQGEGDSKDEKKSIEESSSKRRKLANGGALSDIKKMGDQKRLREKPFRPNTVMVELIITFLIRLGLMTCEVHETRFLSIRCLKLLEQAMKVWKGGELKFIYIQKILGSPQNQQDPSVLLTCTLEVLNILLTHQPKEFIVKHISEIQEVLKKCYHLPNISIRKGLCGVISKIVSAHPGFAPRNGFHQSTLSLRVGANSDSPEPEIAKFYAHLRDTIDQGLRQIHLDKQGMRAMEKVSIHTIVALVSEISKVCTNYMDSTLSTSQAAISSVSASFGHLIKAAHKLAKDHVQNPMLNLVRGRDVTAAQREQQKAAQILDTLMKALTLIRNRAHAVAEHKKIYFQTLALLIDKSNHVKLLLHIAETVRGWMSNKGLQVPNFTHKERVNFILKMTRFEELNSKELTKTYLGMVLELFEAHRYIQRPEWLSKLQEPFMLGLCCNDMSLKHRFREIFHQCVEKKLYLRLNSILSTQDWEPLKGKFWISQALDMMLSIVVESDGLKMSANNRLIPGPRPGSYSTPAQPPDAPVPSPSAMEVVDSKQSPLDRSLEGVPERIKEILKQYKEFLDMFSDLKVEDILLPMRELIHYDRKFASDLWVMMLSKAWSRLTNGDRDMLSEPIIELLSQDWHIVQQYENPNPVQILLDGFSRCSPIPPIRPELLQYLAQTFKCWHIVVRILEERVLRSEDSNTLKEFDNLSPDWDEAFDPDYNTASHNALQEVYKMLKEDNVMFGLLNRRVKSGYSKAALALEQFGWWSRAQDQFFNALKKLQRKFYADGDDYDYKKQKFGTRKPQIKTLRIKGFKQVKIPQRKNKKPTKSLKGPPSGRKSQKVKNKSRGRRDGKDDDIENEDSLAQVGEAEVALWQSEWVRCARHLNQWEVLSDFSKTIGHPEMQLECAWRESEWERIKDIFGTDFPGLTIPAPGTDASSEEKNLLRNFNAKTMLYYNYMVLHDRKSHEDHQLEHLLNQSVQKALLEWQTMPNFVSQTHTGLLHRFHILVELKESIGIIHELNNYRRQNQVPNLKTFITTWRERLPNKWEEIPVWSEVTTWRNQMFHLITTTFPSINDMNVTGYSRMHDTPWTFIKFAQIARKQHLSTVCLTSLAKLYRYPSMEPMDAFSKLRENIKCCLQSPMEIRAALNIISKCNLEYFTNEQKAEIFRLKGEALQHLGYGDESNTAFSAAISICDTYGKAWLSWAIFCDRVFTLKQDLQWAKHAVVCYLQAIRHKKNRARLLIARILWLLSYDSDQGPVNQAFTRYTEHLPPWIWLLWIPQLLSSLARPEGIAVKNILCKIARQYPQALYYTVRAYLIEKREIRNSASASRQKSQSSKNSTALLMAANIKPPQLTTAEAKNFSSLGIHSGYSKLHQAILHLKGVQASMINNNKQKTKIFVEFEALINYFKNLCLVIKAAQQQQQKAAAAKSAVPNGTGSGPSPMQTESVQRTVADQKALATAAAAAAQTGRTSPALAMSLQAVTAVKPDGKTALQTNAQIVKPMTLVQGQGSPALQAQYLAQMRNRQMQAIALKAAQQQSQSAAAAAQQAVQQAALNRARSAAAQPGTAAQQAKSTTGATGATTTQSNAPSSSKKTSAANGPTESSSNAIKWVEDVVSVLRRSHPTLMTEVEKMLDEFSRRFKPEPEEELLGAVHALILKCFKQQLSTNDRVPPVLQTTISRVCRKFFTPDPKSGNKKHLAFVQKYKKSFEQDFLPKTTKFPITLELLLRKLKRWKAHLQYKVGERTQIHLRLEKLSPYLIRFQSYDIEIPGQYLTDQEPTVDQNVVLYRFHPDVKVHHTHGFSHRRIGMCGNDGKRYSFLVQYSISHITRSDERMMQVYVLFNRMMEKYRETRNRNLVFHVPLVVPLTHRLRLMQTNEAHISLEEVYEQSCAVRRIDPDKPLLTYREMMQQVEGCEQNMSARVEAYDRICESVVPDYILTRFIDRIVRAPDEYWAFKKEFAAQIAISGFLSYIMNIGDRSLHKLSFSKKSGRIINSEFYPAYNQFCIIDCQESVPFRLTRNITTFLTPLMVDGIVASVLTAANSCLLRNQDVIRNYLCLFIRDDLLSWNSTKMSMPDDRGQRQLESQLRDKIRNNVGLIIKRLHLLMPSQSDSKNHPPQPMNYKVLKLIEDATSKQRLSMMSSTWQPWF
ncbi:hypothetical protein AAMO2058_001518200 [Amorphochlora amoebiformis]